MPGAGELRERFRFEPPAAGAIVGGLNKPGAFTQEGSYTCAAAVLYLKGTEPVQAARLQGDQPVVITVRTCRVVQAIDNRWRAVDVRNPTRVLDITSAAPNKDTAFVDILAVQKRGN